MRREPPRERELGEDFEGAVFVREMPDDKVLVVYCNFFSWKVCVGPSWEVFGFDEFWEYPYSFISLQSLVTKLRFWDGHEDPLDGWIRHGKGGKIDRAQ